MRWLSLSSSLRAGWARAQPAGALASSPARHFAAGGKVFTGTADVRTDNKSPEDVATDSNRHWMAGDDLGMRVEAATAPSDGGRQGGSTAADKAASSRSSDKQPEAGAEEAMADEADACHPADPYCTAGEEPPRPDDFHEEGDGTTPPSSGFPA